MKLIVEVNARLVLLEPANHRQLTSWPGHGQIVWRDAESRSTSCDVREVVVLSGTYSLVRFGIPSALLPSHGWSSPEAGSGLPSHTGETYWPGPGE